MKPLLNATFAELIEHLYKVRFTGKIELDFLNGIPRSFSPPGERVVLSTPVSSRKLDKRSEVVDAVTV